MRRQNRLLVLFRSPLVLASIFLITSSVAAQNIYQTTVQSHSQQIKIEIPPGWTVFRGQSGLIVVHPLGWNVKEQGVGAFLTYRLGPGGMATALAMVAPMQKFEGQALEVVQGVGQIFPELFPNVNILKSRLLSQNPEVALAEMQYVTKGLPFKGMALCFKKDNRGVLYAITGNTSTWLQDEPVMKQILSRFLYPGESGNPAGGSSPLPQMVPWN